MSVLRQNRAFVGALAMLAVLYITYNFMHPRGFSTAVLVQNANEVVAIAFVAMAQTLPVLLGGRMRPGTLYHAQTLRAGRRTGSDRCSQ